MYSDCEHDWKAAGLSGYIAGPLQKQQGALRDSLTYTDLTQQPSKRPPYLPGKGNCTSSDRSWKRMNSMPVRCYLAQEQAVVPLDSSILEMSPGLSLEVLLTVKRAA